MQEKLLGDRTGDATPRIREQRARTSNRVGRYASTSATCRRHRHAGGDPPRAGTAAVAERAARDPAAASWPSAPPPLASAYGRSDRIDDQVATTVASLSAPRAAPRATAGTGRGAARGPRQRRLDLANAYGRLRRGAESTALLDAIERELAPDPDARVAAEAKEDWVLLWANAADARGVQRAREGDIAAAEDCFAQARAAQRRPGGIHADRGALVAGRLLQRLAWGSSAGSGNKRCRAWTGRSRTTSASAASSRGRPLALRLLSAARHARRLPPHLGDQAGADADRARGIELIEGRRGRISRRSLAPDAPRDRPGGGRRRAVRTRRPCGRPRRLPARHAQFESAAATASRRNEQYHWPTGGALGNCAQAEFASGDVGAARATTARALELSRARKGGENSGR
jgi:hypothetical protein